MKLFVNGKARNYKNVKTMTFDISIFKEGHLYYASHDNFVSFA